MSKLTKIPNAVIMKFVGGPMDGVYSGSDKYAANISLLLHGYYERTNHGEVGAIVQPISPRGLQDNFKPEHLRTEGIKGPKYLVTSNKEIDGQTVIELNYRGVGGHPDAM